ncbi:hypothetical protein BURK2_00586 [Burkholderiales bacterium]|nr:hypothetical protein BURK2_00586 [Burkholderiales bacterium]
MLVAVVRVMHVRVVVGQRIVRVRMPVALGEVQPDACITCRIDGSPRDADR